MNDKSVDIRISHYFLTRYLAIFLLKTPPENLYCLCITILCFVNHAVIYNLCTGHTYLTP